MSKLETNTIDTISGSTNLTLGGTNATDITIPSGVTITNNGTQSGFGGTNTPAFKANMSGAQSFSQNATFKVDFDTEVFDTDSAYDPSTNQRFTVPSGKAGKYYIHGKIFYNDINSTDAYEYCSIFKNGSEFARGQRRTVGTTGRDATVSVSEILNLTVGDYIEIYGKTNAGNGSLNGDAPLAVFEGYKLVE